MERPVGELNPSHSRDSGAATPVASRAIFFVGDGRGSNPPPQVHGLPSSPDEYRHRDLWWVVVESHHVLLVFSQASRRAQHDFAVRRWGRLAATLRGGRQSHMSNTKSRSAAPRLSSSRRNRTSETPVNSRLPSHSASLECDGGPAASRPPIVGVELSKSGALVPRAEKSVHRTRAVRSFGGRDRTCASGFRDRRPSVGPPRIVADCVGSEGIEPSPHRLRAGCATATRRACRLGWLLSASGTPLPLRRARAAIGGRIFPVRLTSCVRHE